MNEAVEMKSERIAWVDIYKGILIFLVVLGHATGKFNAWIYQFHMVGFFFISGYLSNIEKKNGLVQVCKNFFNEMFPYFFISIIAFGINAFFNMLGIYEFLFGYEFIGIGNSIKIMLMRGDIFAQYLGALWFLPALFSAKLIQVLIVRFWNSKISFGYFMTSTALYAIGFYFAYTGNGVKVGCLNLTIALIAQFYCALGVLCKKQNVFEVYLNNKFSAFIICFIVAIGISFWGMRSGVYMDLVSLTVVHPIASVIVACASIFIVICLSKIIEKTVISKSISIMGKNSLGIMVLHFAIFKICFVVYYKMNLLSANDITRVVLPDNSAVTLWLPMTIISIMSSLLIWSGLKKFRFSKR